MLTLQLADAEGLRWAQDQVIQHHYLHHPVDVRCRPLAYLVMYGADRVGCLIFGRPEATKVGGYYGSLDDVAAGKCRLSYWSVLNMARVWLSPAIQFGGADYIPNAATQVIAQALRRVPYDYLIQRPPVWVEEPYEVREILSYCDTRVHTGALYRASNFRLVRTNERGIETYARPVRRLTHAEHAHIRECSQHDRRAQRLRSAREYKQLSWIGEEAAS